MKRTILVSSLMLIALPLQAAEQRLILDPERTEVSFALEATGHDVHGVVTLESGEVAFDLESGAASGAIVLDATRAVTGNASRDRTMRGEVLDTTRFPTIEFLPARVTGALTGEGSSELTLHGVIRLHGDPHPLALPAKVETHGDHVTATATFSIPYQEWGLHDPSVLFLKVAKVVSVTVRAEGELSPPPGAAAGQSK